MVLKMKGEKVFKLRPKFDHKSESAFSLLEVIVSIGILAVMVIAISTMLSGGIELRFALSEKSKVTQRVNNAMRQISEDVGLAFVLTGRDTIRNAPERFSRTLFVIEKGMRSDKISLTTMNHRASRANARESSLSYVVYEVKESKEQQGRSHLYRGVSEIIPSDLRQEPELKLLAENIKSIRLDSWVGDGWSKDGWATNRRETRDRLPHMVKIVVEAFEDDIEEGVNELPSDATLSFETQVFLPYATQFEELKPKSSNLRF
jgi:type II secretory pathway pseudopilin PulG